jgi:hypothetical protein
MNEHAKPLTLSECRQFALVAHVAHADVADPVFVSGR